MRRALASCLFSAESKRATRCWNTAPIWLAASAGGSFSQASASPASVTMSMPCLRASCSMAAFSVRQCMKSARTPQMRRADEVQFVVEHAEHRVALEIDALHIGPHREIVHADTEAQSSILAAEREEMALERGLLQPRKLPDVNVHGLPCSTRQATQSCAGFHAKRWKQSRAATSVASISGLSCAADTKPV